VTEFESIIIANYTEGEVVLASHRGIMAYAGDVSHGDAHVARHAINYAGRLMFGNEAS
jgi:hypothetical protein